MQKCLGVGGVTQHFRFELARTFLFEETTNWASVVIVDQTQRWQHTIELVATQKRFSHNQMMHLMKPTRCATGVLFIKTTNAFYRPRSRSCLFFGDRERSTPTNTWKRTSTRGSTAGRSSPLLPPPPRRAPSGSKKNTEAPRSRARARARPRWCTPATRRGQRLTRRRSRRALNHPHYQRRKKLP